MYSSESGKIRERKKNRKSNQFKTECVLIYIHYTHTTFIVQCLCNIRFRSNNKNIKMRDAICFLWLLFLHVRSPPFIQLEKMCRRRNHQKTETHTQTHKMTEMLWLCHIHYKQSDCGGDAMYSARGKKFVGQYATNVNCTKWK